MTMSVEGGLLIGPPSFTLAHPQRIAYSNNVLPKCVSRHSSCKTSSSLSTLCWCRSVDLSGTCAMFNGRRSPHSLPSVLPWFYPDFLGHQLQPRHFKTRSGPSMKSISTPHFPSDHSCTLNLASRGQESVRLSPRLSSSMPTRAKISFTLPSILKTSTSLSTILCIRGSF